MNANPSHHLQIIFRNKDGSPIGNARYRLQFNGQWLTGTTDANGHTELVQGKAKPVEIWLIKDGEKPEHIGEAKMRPVTQKPVLVARQVEKSLIVNAATEEHAKKPVTKVPLKKYSLQFNVPTFGGSGRVSYRMVQDGKVLAEDRTKNKTQRIYTDSESEVSLYIAGDKRYKKGEEYVEEKSATTPVATLIPAWAKATPSNNIKHVDQTASFDAHDWVDVSKIYGIDHSDITTESKGIYAREWTPTPKDKERHRRYIVTMDGREVVLYWEQGSCDNGLHTKGRKTFNTVDPDTNWFMSVDQVITRTHPKVFKVLFDVVKELNLTYVHISSSWRPGVGSSAHREGRALDITQVKAGSQKLTVKDYVPGTSMIDNKDGPSTTEPGLMEKVRLALYKHTEVEQIFTPWHGMFGRGATAQSSFKKSYVLQPVPTTPRPGESEASFKVRRDGVIKANKDSSVQSGESGTFKAHRNHLHFHVKLD